MKSRVIDQELRSRVEELEAKLNEQRMRTDQAIAIHSELAHRIEILEMKQHELFASVNSVRDEMTVFKQSFHEEMSRALLENEDMVQTMVQIRDAYQDNAYLVRAVEELNEVRLKVNSLESALGEVSRMKVDAEELRQKAIEIDLTARRIHQVAQRVGSRKCSPKSPVSPVSTEHLEAMLARSLEEERARLNLRMKSIVCPLNPLSELCFSDIQRHVHRLIDYAQRSAGTQVVASRTSPSFRYTEASSSLISSVMNIADMLHINLDGSVGPEIALSRDNSLGNCWPMSGSEGNLTIQLHTPIYIHSISIDHISRYSNSIRNASMTFRLIRNEAIDITTAPKDFAVYASDGSRDLER